MDQSLKNRYQKWFHPIKKPVVKPAKVPGTGIEPAHPCEYQILSLARLPIPPSGLEIRLLGCKCKDLSLLKAIRGSLLCKQFFCQYLAHNR